ncbi:MAG: hypothetical protein EXS08_08295 [Planctomycetes bacterium]|nr:hypothetical protein [Planctomycetota bacterium]
MKGIPGRVSPPAVGVLLGLLALGLALRLANAATGSLKLDDFHSLFHARATDLAEFFRVLRLDNHPPLSFLLVHAARALFGESPWALRLPSLLSGMGTLLVAWRLGARLSSRTAQALLVWLLAVSTLHVELSTDVRMYALLALASVGLLEGLVALLEDGRGALRVALWTWVGLHAHYHFLYSLACLAGTAAWLVASHPSYRVRWRPLLAAFACAGALALPWYALGFPAQLRHGLPPGGANAELLRLGEGFKNFLFLNVSVAGSGSGLRALGLAGSGLALLLALSGALALLLRDRARGRLALGALCLASAFGVPLLAWLAARCSPRAGYEWRYLVGALPAFALLVAVEGNATGRLAVLRRAAALLVALSALVLSVANARDPGEEDYQGGVAWILEQATPQDVVVAADWQPGLFPHALAWNYYAERLQQGRELPRVIAHTSDYSLQDPWRVNDAERVFCCLRSLPNGCGLLRRLRADFAHEDVRAFGRSVYVHTFTRE